MFIVYNFFVGLILLIFLPYILTKLSSNNSKDEWLERLGNISNASKLVTTNISKSKKNIWIHCASVGEVKLAKLLIEKLYFILNSSSQNGEGLNVEKKYNFFLSVITPSARKFAHKENLLVEKIFYFPVDFFLFTTKILRTIMPEMVIIVETEIWPSFIWSAKNFGSKVVIVNGRISDKSYKIYRIFSLFFKEVFKKINFVLAREEIDSFRFIKLGVNKKKVIISGNMKYDYMFTVSNSKTITLDQLKQYKKDFGFNENDIIFTAGSIREGEEKIIINAFIQIREKIPEIKLIIAPRHIGRTKYIIKELEYKKISYILKSFDPSLQSGEEFRLRRTFDVCILDTIGDLIDAYRISDITFVGGSLLKFGGHNILEPISVGKIVLFGPYIENFKEPAKLLKREEIGVQVNNYEELVEKIIFFLSNPQILKEKSSKIKKVINSISGTIEKNTELLVSELNC